MNNSPQIDHRKLILHALDKLRDSLLLDRVPLVDEVLTDTNDILDTNLSAIEIVHALDDLIKNDLDSLDVQSESHLKAVREALGVHSSLDLVQRAAILVEQRDLYRSRLAECEVIIASHDAEMKRLERKLPRAIEEIVGKDVVSGVAPPAAEEGDLLPGHTYTVLDVSTQHITREDGDRLTDAQMRAARGQYLIGGLIVYAYDEGAFIFCGHLDGDIEDHIGDLLPNGNPNPWSSDLRDILCLANKSGHRYVNFDADGPEIAGLPTHEW